MENLPRYFTLESFSNKSYLRCVHEDVVLKGHVEFSGNKVISIYTKFEAEPVRNGAYRGLFNIRCCYNNKYWRRKDENTAWITATAAEPVEDRFSWSCTLFELSVTSLTGRSQLILRHVQDSQNVPVSIGSDDPTYQLCLKADANQPVAPSGEDPNIVAPFYIIDWESFVILPRAVQFKGDDGLYLRVSDGFLSFIFSDKTFPIASHVVLYEPDGYVRIAARFLGTELLYWNNSASYVAASPPNSGYNLDYALFSLVKGHGDNEVAIRSKSHGYFCQRPTQPDAKMNYSLRAAGITVVKETIMRVEEPVISRSVYDVNYRLEDARIYNQSDVIMVRKHFSNPLGVDKAVDLIQTFTKETTRTWNSIVTLKLATPTTIETSIPSIVDGKVEFTEEFVGRYEWGTDMKGYETTELSDHINIPPRSTVTVHVIATRGTCDVPFYYMQRDTFTNGNVYINKMDDGVYTGINYYNFKAQVVKTALMAGKN